MVVDVVTDIMFLTLNLIYRKPKTKRAKRFLEKREPKLKENTKNAMLIKGGNANLTVTEVLKDIVSCWT